MNNFLETIKKESSFPRAAFLVLLYIHDVKTYKGTQSQLGDILELDRKTINKNLKLLEEEGYLKRTPIKKGDGRLKKITLTGKDTQNA